MLSEPAVSVTKLASIGLLSALLSLPWAQCTVAAPKNASNVALRVTDLTGKRHVLSQSGAKASVLVFISHDCPICNAYAPEINRLAADYAKQKVDFFVVYAESDLSAAAARDHARQFGYRVPVLIDTQHRLSLALGATVTPETALLSSSGKRLYLGRIDNRYATWGQKRRQTTQYDLRDALDAVLAGQPVPHSSTRAIGCFIPDAASVHER